MVRQTAAIAAGLVLAVALVWRWLGGPAAMGAGAAFGALAAVLQTGAVALTARPLAERDYRGLLARWFLGAGIRLVGVALIPVAVVVDRERFPPLAAGLGYLAVLVPLFFLEIRRFR